MDVFLEGAVGLLPLAPLCKMPEGKPTVKALREVIRAIDDRLAMLEEHAQAVRLMTASYILTKLRVPKDRLPSLFDGVKIMHKLPAYDQALLEAYMPILRTLGEKKFKAPERKTEAALNAIDDPDRVQRMIEAILDVNSWKELLAIR